jgi:hypothetical protein
VAEFLANGNKTTSPSNTTGASGSYLNIPPNAVTARSSSTTSTTVTNPTSAPTPDLIPAPTITATTTTVTKARPAINTTNCTSAAIIPSPSTNHGAEECNASVHFKEKWTLAEVVQEVRRSGTQVTEKHVSTFAQKWKKMKEQDAPGGMIQCRLGRHNHGKQVFLLDKSQSTGIHCFYEVGNNFTLQQIYLLNALHTFAHQIYAKLRQWERCCLSERIFASLQLVNNF